MGGGKVVDRGCSALESGVFVVTSCGEAARRGGGSVSKIFLAVPLSCRVSAASLVSVCRAWKGELSLSTEIGARLPAVIFFAFPQAHLENSGTLLLEICGEIRVLSSEPPAG